MDTQVQTTRAQPPHPVPVNLLHLSRQEIEDLAAGDARGAGYEWYVPAGTPEAGEALGWYVEAFRHERDLMAALKACGFFGDVLRSQAAGGR